MKNKSIHFEFNKLTNEKIQNLTSKRDGESKIGEKLCFNLESKDCKYVIIGISEDIGPQANMGLKGSSNAFEAFLSRFLNTQSNRFLNGDEIFIAGEIKQIEGFQNIKEAKLRIELLDEYVKSIVNPIIKLGKTLIVIGGGHNNAYPLINASFNKSNKAIDVINLDPHADCRALEGRHSGNPFSYAKKNGFLNQYAVFGLHQQYNSESIYSYLDENKFNYTFFEDYLDQKRNLKNDVLDFIKSKKTGTALGIELDLDSIEMMPSSAFTPNGFSISEARIYLRELAKQKDILYIHLPEGSPQSEIESKIVGKTLSYLVIDFIKENLNFNNQSINI